MPGTTARSEREEERAEAASSRNGSAPAYACASVTTADGHRPCQASPASAGADAGLVPCLFVKSLGREVASTVDESGRQTASVAKTSTWSSWTAMNLA